MEKQFRKVKISERKPEVGELVFCIWQNTDGLITRKGICHFNSYGHFINEVGQIVDPTHWIEEFEVYSKGLDLIIDERINRIKKGYTAKHDFENNITWQHQFIASSIINQQFHVSSTEKIKDFLKKVEKEDRIKQLAIAAAFICADIDRKIYAKYFFP